MVVHWLARSPHSNTVQSLGHPGCLPVPCLHVLPDPVWVSLDTLWVGFPWVLRFILPESKDMQFRLTGYSKFSIDVNGPRHWGAQVSVALVLVQIVDKLKGLHQEGHLAENLYQIRHADNGWSSVAIQLFRIHESWVIHQYTGPQHLSIRPTCHRGKKQGVPLSKLGCGCKHHGQSTPTVILISDQVKALWEVCGEKSV